MQKIFPWDMSKEKYMDLQYSGVGSGEGSNKSAKRPIRPKLLKLSDVTIPHRSRKKTKTKVIKLTIDNYIGSQRFFFSFFLIKNGLNRTNFSTTIHRTPYLRESLHENNIAIFKIRRQIEINFAIAEKIFLNFDHTLSGFRNRLM